LDSAADERALCCTWSSPAIESRRIVARRFGESDTREMGLEKLRLVVSLLTDMRLPGPRGVPSWRHVLESKK
jgi:hypothetical protein